MSLTADPGSCLGPNDKKETADHEDQMEHGGHHHAGRDPRCWLQRADVGAGRGELTVALAAEVGPSGQVFSTDIDTVALEQIRARVAAAARSRT